MNLRNGQNYLRNDLIYLEIPKTVQNITSDAGQRTNGLTDRRTDKASYRVACPQLKMVAGDDYFQHLRKQIPRLRSGS